MPAAKTPPDGDEQSHDASETRGPARRSAETIANVRDAIEATFGPVPHVSLRDAENGAGTVESRPGASPSSLPDSGRYQILGEIARGGMGAVFRARDGGLNRELAIKVLLERYSENSEVVGRFVEEAQIGGQLQHPGIVPVYDLGQFGDKRPFFAMKLIKGRTLADMLNERQTPADDLPRYLKIFEQICETMAYAHSKGVIHRDLKPPNVMVGAFGEVQVMDWGLAKVLDGGSVAEKPETVPEQSVIRTVRSVDGSDPTQHGAFLGTAAYMPPEQARGDMESLSERADVFALGSILCQVLTGAPAYTGRSHQEIKTKAISADLDDARSRLAGCGAEPELIAIATTCLAKSAEDRPRDASEVARRISAYVAGVQERLRKAEIARVEATARADVEQARRRFTVALAGALLLAVTIGGGSWMAFRLDRDRRIAETDRTVGDALGRAEVLRAEAERAGGDGLDAWTGALAAADKARDLLAGRSARRALTARVEELHVAVAVAAGRARQRAERREADHRLVTALDEARLAEAQVKDGHFDGDAVGAAYAKAFRDAKLDVFALRPEVAASLLADRHEKERIAAALDAWAWVETVRPRKAQLSSIAKQVDPDPFRNKLRAAMASQDAAALLALVKTKDVDSLPAPSVVLLAGGLRSSNYEEEAITVLTTARKRYPSDFWIHQNLGALWNRKRDLSGTAEAVRFLTVALALKPDSPGVLVNLGVALHNQGKLAEAIDVYRQAIRLKPDYAEAQYNLGSTLRDDGKVAESIDALHQAIRLKPDFAEAHNNLGNALLDQGNHAEAIDAYHEAIRLKPDFADAYSSLGNALREQGKPAESIDACREAIRLEPELAAAHNNLGIALASQGNFAEAIDAFHEAIRLRPDFAKAHHNLGRALQEHGNRAAATNTNPEAVRLNPDDGIAEYNLGATLLAEGKLAAAVDAYRQAVRLKPNYAAAHYNLGIALLKQGKVAEAVDAYHQAIRCKPDLAEAHCNLGQALQRQGDYVQALASLRRGHELGSKRPDWRYPSAAWVGECERLVKLEARLPAILKEDDQPVDNADRLSLARVCSDKRLYAAAVRFWGEALAADPRLGDDRKTANRYTAARSAALAGSGLGRDDPKPEEAARITLRAQARSWLAEELAAWAKVAESGDPADRASVTKTLMQWKSAASLAGIRNADALARLSEDERASLQSLWADVDGLLKKAAER
jgi:serine/threonine-protein kinase